MPGDDGRAQTRYRGHRTDGDGRAGYLRGLTNDQKQTNEEAATMFMNPILTWSRLAWKTGEMARDSAQVIAMRSKPDTDRAELLLMGREKGEAALDSMQAMALPLMRTYQLMAALGFSQMTSIWASMLSMGRTHTPAQAAQQQLKLVDETIKRTAVAASKVASSSAAVARSALKPVHRRVKANVTRLSKNTRSTKTKSTRTK